MFLDPSGRKELGRYMTLAQVGMEIVAPGVVGLFLDHQFGWSPWGVIVGMALGLAGGLVHLVRLSNESNEDGDTPPGGAPGGTGGATPPSPTPPQEPERR